MCRIIYGCMNMDGEILSGSNGDDPALDFSVKKTERGFEIYYKTAFSAVPSLTVTPNYGELTLNPLEGPLGNLVLVSNESKSFKLLGPESNAIRPQNFSFIAIR